MSAQRKLETSLLLLRIGVFIVMAMWSLDKPLKPDHAAAVFENFYFIAGIGAGVLLAIGLIQLAIEVAFLLGLWKFWTYGFVLVTHAISTLSSWKQYLDPFNNMLFLAAIPMLAACIALFLLRKEDGMLTLGQ
jgi:putative oxidoreductase